MNNTFIFFNTGSDDNEPEAVVFQNPVKFITCSSPDEVEQCLVELDAVLADGFFAAGFLSYELGHIFQEIPLKKRSDFPLFCFGIFESFKKLPVTRLLQLVTRHTENREFHITDGHYSVPCDAYRDNIARIKKHLEDGNSYQVNYTFKYKFAFRGSPEALFLDLVARQEVPYASFIQLDRWALLSLSPELFFHRKKQEIMVRPMKGTIARGKTSLEDDLNSRYLAKSAKDRAENIMIVDLLRNDLGRISTTGSVEPEELFTIEKYGTLFQMTSTIRANIRKDVTWYKFFQNIFPSGSVTGAPKKRTMEIIQDLEDEERGIYTGSMGYITPFGQALFNVAIRTVLIDKDAGKGELGIGSGIVYDSDPKKEYDECLLKGFFLTGADHEAKSGQGTTPRFDLIETMLWNNGSYYLSDLHLARMERSAAFFSFPFNKGELLAALKYKARSFDASKKYRIRISLDKDGKIKISAGSIKKALPAPVNIALSDKSTQKDNVFLSHKTTNRELYDSEFSKYRKKDCFDVLFFNEDGELTEGAITNVILRKDQEYFTPPISCGLLGGVYREHLMTCGEITIEEKVLRMEDLKNADEILLINSVRKIVPAVLVE
ncbi:MAG: aminodeoxychorismate synthase component I [Candidatus Omnitrophica bacterium]|nr:aminodeoxychorismate synthase component I [Candidatus Omnitrophota bacterium]